jgi:hypothetical protein
MPALHSHATRQKWPVVIAMTQGLPCRLPDEACCLKSFPSLDEWVPLDYDEAGLHAAGGGGMLRWCCGNGGVGVRGAEGMMVLRV